MSRVMKIRVNVKEYVARAYLFILLTCPCVGRVEVAFDGTLPFRGWQTCPGPTSPIYQCRKGSFNRFGG
jgi:hypothetical protein